MKIKKIEDKLALIAHSVFRFHHRYIEKKLPKTNIIVDSGD